MLRSVGFLGWAVLAAASEMRSDDFPNYDQGTIPAWKDLASLRGAHPAAQVMSKAEYHRQLKSLDIPRLYREIAALMTSSRPYWPADGPQDGDVPSYAGLFARLAWHCSGSFRLINNTHAAGGCEGARQRHWPENEWRDNTNLDKARGLLAEVKLQFGDVSWSDLMTFAGTAAIKLSGGPAKKFCFGRMDDVNGDRSIPLGVEGVTQCRGSKFCKSDAECPNSFRWPEQNDTDHARCNIEQPKHRLQASHSVGLIYVYPEGPELKSTADGYNSNFVHNRSPKLSALEVRDTFRDRMGWTDRETVALIGGGHTATSPAPSGHRLLTTTWDPTSRPHQAASVGRRMVPAAPARRRAVARTPCPLASRALGHAARPAGTMTSSMLCCRKSGCLQRARMALTSGTPGMRPANLLGPCG
mmetsp:Transcript_31268/g.74606  ORF Transcript_31268/g.74606 Transcript_31268/m.74606 type:complete len:414 (+) Transcript_31268:65-1306(+)